MANLNVHDGDFQPGSPYSDVLSIGSDFIVGLVCPEEWTGAVATVMVSVQGDNYFDLFDGKGNEFTFNITPGAMISIDPNLLLCAGYVRLRSGTRDIPVVQDGGRRFYLIGASSVALR